jgi:hypothetical protein
LLSSLHSSALPFRLCQVQTISSALILKLLSVMFFPWGETPDLIFIWNSSKKIGGHGYCKPQGRFCSNMNIRNINFQVCNAMLLINHAYIAQHGTTGTLY